MNLREMTSEQLIVLSCNASTKEEVLSLLADKLYQEMCIDSKTQFLEDVMDREHHSPTGLDRGIAIPHGKSSSVKKAAFAYAKLNNQIKGWESVMGVENPVDMVFLLAIPKEEGGSTHLELLSQLSVKLMDESFTKAVGNAGSARELLGILEDQTGLNHQEKQGGIPAAGKEPGPSDKSGEEKLVLAVTACAAGIAHTYMSAEALEKAGRGMGIKVLVEKQGANGVEDAHSADLIGKASGVIFATDIAVKDQDRFQGLPYVKVKVADPLKNSEDLIDRVMNRPDGTVAGSGMNKDDGSAGRRDAEKKRGFNRFMEPVLTGISYMIPVIVAAGLMMGIAKLAAMGLGQIDNMGSFIESGNPLYVLLGYLDKFGGMIFKFIYPVFAAYVAYSIADRPGLVPGFIGGAFAGGLHYTFWGVDGGIPSGFLGALVLGLVAGYIAEFLNRKIKLSKNLQAMKPMLLIPGISVLVIFILNYYLVDPLFGGLNGWISTVIASFDTGKTLLLTAVIAACTAFDLGGPVNKAAGAIAMGLAADGIFPLTGRVLAIVIPPIGLGLATILDKYLVKRRVFDESLRVVGNTSILLGLIAISEGAIPFMLRNPLITIPINIIGSIIGACVAVALGAVQWNPLPAVWGWPLVDNLWAYILGLLAGVLFIAVANILVRNHLMNRKEKKD